MQVVVDSSVLVGVLNPLDHRHNQSIQLIRALQNDEHTLVYFDCVIVNRSVQLRAVWPRKAKLLTSNICSIN